MNTISAIAGISPLESFKSKSEVLKYAVEFTAKFEDSGRTPQYDKAQELFDFICNRITLPELPVDPYAGAMEALGKMVTDLKSKDKEGE